jgi:hypothetical protein
MQPDNHQGCAVCAGSVVARIMHGVLATAFCKGFGFLARFPRCELFQGPLPPTYLPFNFPIPILRLITLPVNIFLSVLLPASPLLRHHRRAETTYSTRSFYTQRRHSELQHFTPTTFWRWALARSFTPRIASPHALFLSKPPRIDRQFRVPLSFARKHCVDSHNAILCEMVPAP